MAITTTINVPGSQAATGKVFQLYDLDLATNYHAEKVGDNEVKFRNISCAEDAPFEVTYKWVPGIRNQFKAKSALSQFSKDTPVNRYTVTVEGIGKTTDSTDPKYRIDSRVRAQLTFDIDGNGLITDEDRMKMVEMLLSACLSEDGQNLVAQMSKGLIPPTDLDEI